MQGTLNELFSVKSLKLIVQMHCVIAFISNSLCYYICLSLHAIVFSESVLMNFLSLAVAWSLSEREGHASS